jgi:hypothetical protein
MAARSAEGVPGVVLITSRRIDEVAMRTFRLLTIYVAAIIVVPLSSSSSVPESGKSVLPIGLAPLYDNPFSGALPVSYCEPADTCRVDSSATDSSGNVWLFVKSGVKTGWLQKTSTRIPSFSQEENAAAANVRAKADPDAKRRYRIVEQHPQWPRRIVKMVREGQICIEMTEEQLTASWGEPAQKNHAFILGVGKQNLWIYRQGNESVVVFLVKGRVVGWSEK